MTELNCSYCGETKNLIYCPSCELWFCRDCSDWTPTHFEDCKIIQQRHSELGDAIEKYEKELKILN